MYFPQASQDLDKLTIKLNGYFFYGFKKQGVETTTVHSEEIIKSGRLQKLKYFIWNIHYRFNGEMIMGSIGKKAETEGKKIGAEAKKASEKIALDAKKAGEKASSEAKKAGEKASQESKKLAQKVKDKVR